MERKIMKWALAGAVMAWAGAAHGWVTNIGAGAHGSWSSGDFYIGSNTSENAINLYEGGTFATTAAGVDIYLGYDSGANSNAVAIDGGGTVWTNTRWWFHVGYSGDYNSMTITDGGRFDGSSGSAFYVGRNDDSQFNSLVAAGSDSSIELQYTLGIGWNGSANYFELSDGAAFDGRDFVMGRESSASFNTGLVTGAGSRLTTQDDRTLYVGYSGSSNVLTVAAGGQVANYGYMEIGGSSGAEGNEVVVDGAGSSLAAGRGVTVGDGGDNNAMVVSGGASYTGGLHVTGSPWDQFDHVGRGGDGNELLVTGTGTTWNSLNRFYVGYSDGHSNSVTVTDGASLETTRLFVYEGGNELIVSTNATVDVSDVTYFTGPAAIRVEEGGALSGASILHMRGDDLELVYDGENTSGYWGHDVQVGQQDGNANILLAVRNGAKVEAARFLSVGYAANAAHNRLEIDGAGSLLHVHDAGDLRIGFGEHNEGNEVRVSGGGGLQVDGDLDVGREASGTGNRIEVLDGGLISVANGVYVGQEGSDNRLEVSSAGILESETGVIGESAAAENNRAVVTGAGSNWDNSGTIYVSPGGGAGNRLEILDGGNVDSMEMVVGTNGTLLLDSDSTMSAAFKLEIQDGGRLEGDGSIWGNIDNAGIIAPGQSAGELEILGGGLTLQETSVLQMEIGGTAISEYDRILGDGGFYTLTLAGKLNVILIDDFNPEDGDTFALFEDWQLAGDFDAYELPPLTGGLEWDTSGMQSDGTLTVIPEPATLLLLLPALLYIRRRRSADG